MSDSKQPIMVAMIAAIGVGDTPEMQGIYGIGNDLPWAPNKIKKDMMDFKAKTINQVVIMGRGTWESFKEWKPLPNRLNIVVSNTMLEGKHFENNDETKPYHVCRSIDGALKLAFREALGKHIFFIGGYDIWHQAIPYCTDIFLTKVFGNWKKEGTQEVKMFTGLLDVPEAFPEFALAVGRHTNEESFIPHIPLHFLHYKKAFEGTPVITEDQSV